MADQNDPAGASKQERVKVITVELEELVMTASGEKSELKFRRPIGGDFRGLAIGKLGQFDYDEIRKLLPRISLDGLTVASVDAIDGADQLELAAALSDFLVPTRRRAEFQET